MPVQKTLITLARLDAGQLVAVIATEEALSVVRQGPEPEPLSFYLAESALATAKALQEINEVIKNLEKIFDR